jgi:hypothetical protein
MKETSPGHLQKIILDKSVMTVKTEASLVREQPDSEHGSEMRGDEIGEGVILSRLEELTATHSGQST